jgi:hypothetical protein
MNIASQRGLFSVVLAVLTMGLYLKILNAEFVYDARSQILIDPYIHQYYHFWDVLSLRVLSQDVLDNARPVHLLSLMVDSLLWGKNPVGYHLTNLLLHTFNTLLLFWFLLHLLTNLPSISFHDQIKVHEILKTSFQAKRLIAFLGALLFAVHPLQSEAVCEVSYREDLLATLFLLLGLFLASFEKPRRKRQLIWILGASAMFFLSTASKENGVAGPFLLALYWYLFRRNEDRKYWVSLISLSFLWVTLFLAARFILQPKVSTISPDLPGYLGGSFPEMLKIEPRFCILALQSVFFPFALSADYGAYSVRFFNTPISILILLVILMAAFKICQHRYVLKFGFLCFLLPLIPVSNLVPIFLPFADRFFYMPMIGVSIALICFFHLAYRRQWHRFACNSFLALCFLLSILTVRREGVWNSSESLWRDTLQKNPGSLIAANNLGFTFFDQKKYPQAIACWQRALELSNNKEPDSWAGLAIVFKVLGDDQRALGAYRKACQLSTRYNNPNLLIESFAWDRAQVEILWSVKRLIGTN